ncbi:MAG: hypothetical protein QMD46_09560 [Methanomicrobiales archaeon]|nr:hypothetical protein [Methanomicrobiales archaeon]MDI6877233.1 hypothetical protein [Methanomicrobiales archaeon]
MKNTLGWLVGLSVLLVLLCIGAGCVLEPTTQEAEAQLCQDLGDLDAALTRMESSNQSSTTAELRAVQDDVTQAMNQVRDSGMEVAEARTREPDAAYQNLENAVRSIPNDATIEEGLASIRDELVAVRNAWIQLEAEVQCP